MTQPTATAPPFAFILANAKTIERAARHYARGTPLPPEDVAAELKIDLIEKWGKYKPERGSASNWIYMRARHVRRSMVRQSVRNSFAPLSDLDALPEGHRGSVSRLEARAEVAVLMSRADDSQQIAAVSIVRDWSPDRVRRKLGCSTVQRTAKLMRLAGRD